MKKEKTKNVDNLDKSRYLETTSTKKTKDKEISTDKVVDNSVDKSADKPRYLDVDEPRHLDVDSSSYLCPVCGSYSNSNPRSVMAHSQKAHKVKLVLENDELVSYETEHPTGSKLQKIKKSDEKFSEDPYIKSLEIEKNRLARENSLLSEQLNQQRLRERGAELPYGYKSPRDYDRNERVLSDISLSDYLDQKTKRLQWGDENHPKSSNENIDLIVSMQKEMSDLKKELSTEKEKRMDDTLKDMSNKISELSKNQIQASNAFGCVDSGIKELGSLAKEYIELGKIAMGISKKRPEREKIGDNSSSFIDKFPPDMVVDE